MMVHVPPWSSAAEDPIFLSHGNGVADDYALFLALQRYLPSNSNDAVPEDQLDTVDAHTCDDFRMFDFKVRKCTRGRSHDWTECPFAHPGEKARRRDPRRFHYSGAACPDFRKGNCRRGDACEYAHGVFECWLHPARYRTQPCKDGVRCTRRVCFFAHSTDQLRVVSPRSESPLSGSPPLSPLAFNETVSSMRKLHLGSSLLSPRVNLTLPGHVSNSNTPTRTPTRPGIGYFEEWDNEDENLERVESGRDLRAKMFEKLSKENPLDRADPDPDPDPDLGWVSELVK